jgi:large subunit ribosomal protein L4e
MPIVYSLKGDKTTEIDLPPCFATDYRPDIIARAVTVMRANRRQPYGAAPDAGHYVAESFGPGRGMSRVPRLASGRAAFMPGTVHGRRAHPPKSEKVWARHINKKEMRLARMSALAATADPAVVSGRGHIFEGEVPFIVEDAFAQLSKTKEVLETLERLGLAADIARAKMGKNVRAGKGKRRGRKYKKPVSLLIVSDSADNLKRAAENLAGVEVVDVDALNVEHLAPGGHPGRLTLYTEGAIARLGERYGSV